MYSQSIDYITFIADIIMYAYNIKFEGLSIYFKI